MKRKLATASIAFSAGILIAVAFLPKQIWLYAAACLLALTILFSLLSRYNFTFPAAVCCFSAACAFIWVSLYSVIVLAPLEKYNNTESSVKAILTAAPKTTDYGSSADIRILNWDAPYAKARIYAFDTDITQFEAGEIIQFEAQITYTPNASFEGADSLAAKGNFTSCACDGEVRDLGRSKFWGLYFPARFALKIKENISAAFPDDVSHFVTALLTGDTQKLSEDSVLSNALSSAGIYHVCAVSGLHVMFIASIVSLLCPIKWIASLITVVLTAIFAAMTGFSPSVLRASFMLIASLAAPLFDREADGVTSLSAILMLLLILNPWAIMGVGLELSFAATLGILLLSPRIADRIKMAFSNRRISSSAFGKRFISSFSAVTATSVGAMMFTIPISALWFGYFSVVSPLTNLLLIWLISLIFYIAVFCSILGFFAMPVAAFFGKAAAYPIRFICFIAKTIARSPVAVLYITGFLTVFWLILLYAGIIILFCMKTNLRLGLGIPGTLLVLYVAFAVFTTQSNNTEGLMTAVLDVGQGQCIILRDSGYTAVIDCGSMSTYKSGEIASKWLRAHGENCIDLMIFTHFDSDHVNGAGDLFSKEKIGAIAMPAVNTASGEYRGEIEYLSDAYNVPVTNVEYECTVMLGSTIITIYPPVEPEADNSGLAVLVSNGDYDILITGDMPQSAELRLICEYPVPDIELLLVGHHGSQYSTAEAFLDSIKPETAVISVGENTFGHPNAATLDRMKTRNITVFRTDEDGTILFGINGEADE